MNMKSVVFELTGKNGIFNSQNSLTLFWEHETVESMNQKIKEVIKQAKQMNKQGEIMLDLGSLINSNYSRDWAFRYIIRSAAWRDNFEVEIRRNINGSFPSVEPFKFVTQNDLFKYVQKHIMEQSFQIMPNIPSEKLGEKCFYSQKLDGTLKDEELLQLMER